MQEEEKPKPGEESKPKPEMETKGSQAERSNQPKQQIATEQKEIRKPPKQDTKPYETETHQIKPHAKSAVAWIIIKEVQKIHKNQDIKRSNHKEHEHQCNMPTYALLARAEIENQDPVCKIFLPDTSISRKHMQTSKEQEHAMEKDG